MIVGLRVAISILVAAVVGFIVVLRAEGYVALLVLVVFGGLAGLLIRSWWSVLAVPAGLLLGTELRCAFEGCETSEDDTAATLAALRLMFYGSATLAAVVATYIAKRLFDGSTRSRGENVAGTGRS